MNHVDAREIPMDEFTKTVDQIDEVMRLGYAALVPSPGSEVLTIQVFDQDKTPLSNEEWSKVADLAYHVDQLLIYAFGQAPRQVIANYALESDADGADIVAKVDYIRSNMPETEKAWDRRRNGVGRSIGRIRDSAVYDLVTDSFQVLISLEAYRSTGVSNSPEASTIQTVEMTLSPGEARYLLGALKEIVDPIPDVDGESDDAEAKGMADNG